MLKLGLPSKGRLQAQVIDAFAKAGITVERTGDDREYAGRVAGVEDVSLVMLSAGEVPKALAEGELHCGVRDSRSRQELPVAGDENEGTSGAHEDRSTWPASGVAGGLG